jgi:iron uptake system component EfeO
MRIRLSTTAGILALLVAAPGAAMADVSPTELVKPIADYKIFILEKLEKLATDTKAYTDAIKAGNLAKAKALFGMSRMSYEAIEPIAELFNDLDGAIDSRVDDHPKGVKDPEFTGFHRLEYALFAKNTTKGLGPIAGKLMADVEMLKKRVVDLALPPEKLVGGAAALMEEVAKTKISGEEDRYSHTDLWDFNGNVEGSRKIFDLVRPLIEKDDGAFTTKVTGNFDTVEKTLAKYKTANGYQSYEKLTPADRKVLAAAVNTLAEDLSTLRGKLGLD